jgi:hypothetical protein
MLLAQITKLLVFMAPPYDSGHRLETRNIQPIRIGLWTIFCVPAHCNKESCSAVVYCSKKISQKFVLRKTCNRIGEHIHRHGV